MNKLTAIVVVSGFTLLPVSTHANWNPNWLIGLEGGYNRYKNDVDVSVTIPALPLVLMSQRDLNANEWIWGGLIGYQATCDGLLIGVELNVDWEGDLQSQSQSYATRIPGLIVTSSASYKRETTVGFTGRLGLQTTCWLWTYARAGFETSIDKYVVSLGQAADPTATFADSVSERSYRFVGGIGFELPIVWWEELSVRAEYNYHSPNRTLKLNGPWAGILATSNTSLHNHTNTVKLAVVYNLGN